MAPPSGVRPDKQGWAARDLHEVRPLADARPGAREASPRDPPGADEEFGVSQFSGNTKQLIHRISGIEGHVRSLKTMIGEDREPLEVLMQLSAIRAAIGRLSHVIFEEFVESTLQGPQTDEEYSAAIADIRAAMETLM